MAAHDLIKFRNGYSPTSPEIFVELRGIRRYGTGRRAYGPFAAVEKATEFPSRLRSRPTWTPPPLGL